MKARSILTLFSCLFALSSTEVWAGQADTKDSAELRLLLQKVSLDAETGKMDEAFTELDKLKAEYPDNPQVLQAEADLNLRLGNRGAGFAALRRALILNPGNEDIIEQQENAMLLQAPFVGGGYKFRQSKQANENFENFSGHAVMLPSVTADLTVENDHLHTRLPITRTNGGTENFSGDRQRIAATLGKSYDNGDEASASLYGNNKYVGGGVLYRMWDHYGATLVQANLLKPNWDYVESVVEHGTKDNIRLERKQVFSGALQATIGGGYNHYNLEDDWGAASAAAWDLNLGYSRPYSFSADNTITLGAYYTVDAEYFTQVDHKTSGGVSYTPLPAKSYEIHSLNFSVYKELSSQWQVEGFGGYSTDRLGGDGPSFGGAIEYAPLEHLGAELRASRGIMGERQSGKVDQIALNLKWHW